MGNEVYTCTTIYPPYIRGRDYYNVFMSGDLTGLRLYMSRISIWK